MITMTQTTTGPAFETVSRGVSYYLRTNTMGRYELSSRRMAIVKAFRGLLDMLNAPLAA